MREKSKHHVSVWKTEFTLVLIKKENADYNCPLDPHVQDLCPVLLQGQI